MIILGIETSCDETALCLLETRGAGASFECRTLSSLVHSQAELHSAYGGVYPNLAKREHGKNIIPLLHKLFIDSEALLRNATAPEASVEAHSSAGIADEHFNKVIDSFRTELSGQNPELFKAFSHADFLKSITGIDRIAVTEGPGLEPALWVGISLARMLSALWDVPLFPVNHMEGHVLGSLLPSEATNGAWHRLFDAQFPSIALLISGGHTELVKVKALRDYEIIGETKDDAVGEAYDKAARLLGLSYPGGPHLAELAHKAWEEKIPAPVKLPRPMISSKDLDFSFSGLKTAVLYAVRAAPKDPNGSLTEDFKKGLAHEFQEAVKETLDSKLKAGIEKAGARSIIVGGGVSANHVLRKKFEETAKEFDIPIFLPSRHVSGDNALMIALAGALHSDARTPVVLRAQGTKRIDEKS